MKLTDLFIQVQKLIQRQRFRPCRQIRPAPHRPHRFFPVLQIFPHIVQQRFRRCLKQPLTRLKNCC